MRGMSLKMRKTVVDYKMVDEKPVREQVHEMLLIAQETTEIGKPITKYFQVSIIIGKLPPCWKDYRKLLESDRTIKRIEDLLQNLQTKDEARKRDKAGDEEIGKIKSMQDKVHMIEQKEKDQKEKEK